MAIVVSRLRPIDDVGRTQAGGGKEVVERNYIPRLRLAGVTATTG